MKTAYTCLFLLFAAGLFAQDSGLRGLIRDTDNQPLAFASIYVNETGDGAVTNEEGYYELRLPAGSYTVIFQYLGYQTKVEKITIGDRFRDFDISLRPQAFELKEVEISSDGEDPAYTVMRRAIAKAEYHRQQLDEYSAQVYIKGSGRLLKSPGILRKFVEREGIDSTLAFTSETVSEISYERPNTYNERVISVYTEGDDRSTSPMRFINGSFYEESIAGAISPLSKKAFGYYKFKLAGYFEDRGYLVNKIQVIPRSRGDKVFEGYIYIIEDYWSIHSLELSTYQLGFRFDINTLFNPIEKNVWMPVRYTFYVSGAIFGFKFEYEYLTTVSQYEIVLNPDLPTELEVVDDKINKELAAQIKAQRKENPNQAETVEKLSQGEELTRKELRKLMREYEKEERQELEEPDVVIATNFKVDSNAYKKDSAFWAEIRPIPLTKFEVKGYEFQDSVAKAEVAEAEDSEAGRNSQGNGLWGLEDLLFGESYKLGDGKYLSYESPITDLQFNPVEGLNGTGSLAYLSRRDSFDMDIGMQIRYGYRWKRVNFRAYSEFEFGPNEQNVLSIDGGRFVEQYNRDQAVPELFNTIYSIWNRNFVNMYEREFGQLQFNSTWSPAGSFYVGAEWARRRYIEDFFAPKWIPEEDDATPNWPENAEAAYPFPNREKAFTVRAGIEVRPFLKYRLRNGNKRVIENSSPTFGLNYRGGIPNVAESTTDYNLLEFSYEHKFPVGFRGNLDLRLNAGIFLNADNINLIDFKHFPGNQMLFTSNDPVASFRLLPYYEFSTQEEFVSAHAHYQFRKFLLTQIWEINLLGIKENVFSNYLYTPSSQHYFELGYGIDNIFRVFRLEFVTSFRDGSYDDFGVRIGIASNIGNGLIDVN